MSRSLKTAGGLMALCSVLVATVLSLATRDLLLPVLPLIDEARSLVFFCLPVGATIGLGLAWRQPGRSIALLAALLTVVLSWAVWIGWIVVECGIQDNRCFD
jgi:hypothetical protein